ncbi:glycosyl transferase family 39 [Candidatus Moduliflexus flocculans]|uniref:Glycosyl transferase family 39 n=1 Tax=Candidatus Moduliflexus flocculans TaxID=1499966 RepID=A0A0S6VQ91_9BACT|nr:glycosyl transferase family 39 [Candidatus Moduliflexus flocculans]
MQTTLNKSPEQRRIAYGNICAIALFVRFVFILTITPSFDARSSFSIDAESYHQTAKNLVERHIFASTIDPPYKADIPGTFRPPLTPFYLACWYALFGVNLFWGRVGLAVISALSCGLSYWIGYRLYGRNVGVVAGLASCVYPFFLLLVHVPLTEGLSIFLTLLVMAFLLNDTERHPYWHAVGLGVALGLLMLNKASNITTASCVVLWAILRYWRKPSKGIVLLMIIGLTAGCVIAPWTIRNYRVTGSFLLVNSNGGWTMYLGNSPSTDYNLTLLERGDSNGWTPPKEAYQPFRDLALTDVKARDERAARLAKQFIVEHPEQFINLAWRKLKIFWSPYPHPADQIAWTAMAILGIFGLFASFRRWKEHLLIYTLFGSSMLIPIFFTAMPRFRAPLIPFVIIYASSALIALYAYGKRYANRN